MHMPNALLICKYECGLSAYVMHFYVSCSVMRRHQICLVQCIIACNCPQAMTIAFVHETAIYVWSEPPRTQMHAQASNA